MTFSSSSSVPRSKPKSTKASALPVSGAKRLSLKEQLDKILALPDEERARWVEEAEAEELEAREYGRQRETTQRQQDNDTSETRHRPDSGEHKELNALDQERRRRNLSRLGIEEYPLNRYEELKEPVPHATLPGVWHGRRINADEILKKSGGLVKQGLAPPSSEIIKRFGGLVSTKRSWTSADVVRKWPGLVSVAEDSPTQRKVKKWKRSVGLDPES